MELTERLVRQTLRERNGLIDDNTIDSMAAIEISMVIHAAETFEHACRMEDIAPEVVERLLRNFIFSAMPNHAQVQDAQRMRSNFRRHLENEAHPAVTFLRPQ